MGGVRYFFVCHKYVNKISKKKIKIAGNFIFFRLNYAARNI
ncbi:hypothetical protein FORMA_03140 [Formosa sp. Hel3_A1_48]|nr:hypothetical protein FORMA_03140 [Formosa sp. Hel3_A1_48]